VRVFLAIPGSPNPALASSLWRANLHDPLVAMTHDVVLFEDGVQPLFDLDPDAAATDAPRAAFTAKLVDAIDAAHRARPLDLILTYLSSSHVEPAAIARLRARVAPVVNFFCNNVHQFHLVRAVAPAFTISLVPEREAMDDYRAAGASPLYWPMAANPERYRPLDLTPDFGATFAGQRYGERTTCVLALCEAGIDAHAFGPGWDPAAGRGARSVTPGGFAALAKLAGDTLRGRLPWRAFEDRAAWQRLQSAHPGALHGPVNDDAYVALFSRSRINLGFLVLGDTHRTLHPMRQVRLREFEAPMAGGFYLTGWIPEIEDLYVVGREIECYRSREELVDKCRYYLAHDAEREKIRQAGHARARRDHTWTRRFEALFAALASPGHS